MARKIAQRIKVKGKLITHTPLHVGGMSLDPTIDLTLAVDGTGRYYIPGTSLAGALRQWCFGNLGESATRNLWGYQEKDKGHASFITIEDAYFDRVRVEIRDGVGINRFSGAAADKAKFDRAIIPKGVSCEFQMSVEIGTNLEFATNLDNLLDALCAGEIRLGAAKTRGLGRVKLAECHKLTQTFNNRAGIIEALRDTLDRKLPTYQDLPPIKYEQHQPAAQPHRHNPQLKIEIGWKPVGAVMVKDAIEGNIVDILPLTSADEAHLALVIPGSSIKGALRAQAERIVRTVANLPSQVNFLEQVRVPIVEDLFGAAANQNAPKLGRGALFVDDCYGKSSNNGAISPSAWQEVIQTNTEQGLIAALSNANLATVQQAFHVAIDRWTGGAAEHMLYSNLEPFGIEWLPIELTIDLPRLADHKLAAIALLLLLLRDLSKQHIPLGYGANRGMGAIEVTNIQIQSQGISEDELAKFPADFSLTIDSNNAFVGIDRELLVQIDRAWQESIGNIKTGINYE